MDAVIEQNPYLDGEFFAPVRDEATIGPEALQVEGKIPRDFGGIYFRNGPLVKIHIPQRLPAGFHGIWVPQSYLGGR